MTEPPFNPPPAGRPSGDSFVLPSAPSAPYASPVPPAQQFPASPAQQVPVPSWPSQAYAQYGPGVMQPAPASTPPVRSRRALVSVIGVVALVAAFGAGLATGRATSPKAAGVTGNSSASSTTGGADDTTGSGKQIADLVDALMPLPAGARSLTVTGAGKNGSMDLDQYMQVLYPSSPTERPYLQARDFESAAARWMVTGTAQQDDFYLIEFATPDDAQSYALGAEQAHKGDPAHASDTEFSVSALTDGMGFENAKLDSYGNTDSYVYGAVGDIAIIVDCFTPAKLARAEMLTLIDQQAARLLTLENAG